MKRRSVLTTAGISWLFLSGCIARSPGSSRQSDSSEAPTGTARLATSSADTTDEEPPPIMEGQGPARGESDVELEVEEVEDDEEVTYVEDEHAVRYVAAWRHTNHDEVDEGEPPEREPVYETTPFEQWAKTQCTSAAARTAAEHVNEQLDTDEVGGGITSAVEGKDLVAVVSVQTILDRDGDPVSETAVTFDALVAATPANVRVTYRLDAEEYQMTVPVYAQYRVLQQE
ncbi:hypothetical protein [Halobellus sp. H-GB7]|uniref:hypothetical protein n=1 Tax=Halobellus sp. H-GB7 TaxID=3069756 RepID=UPI0027B640A6|nr:hypothetical protein [Halobellus sp. H-GB7]MDQ2054412.1 hypothetical protein [Halobellus sp. H-GB7]